MLIRDARTTRSTSVVSAVGLLLLLTAVPALPDAIGLDFSGSVFSFTQNAENIGFEFQANTTLTVVALGAYNAPDIGWGGEQNVGLWDANGNLIASTLVNNTDTQQGDWYFNSITPVTLVAGENYIVGSQGGTNYTGETPITVSPYITYVEDRSFTFAGASPLNPLTEPTFTQNLTSSSNAGFFGGNLEFATPEPSSLLLLASGLLGLGLRKKLKSNVA